MSKTKTKLSPYRLASRSTYESKRRVKDHRLIHQNKQDARAKLQPASVGLSNRVQAPTGSNFSMLWMLRPEG